MQNKEIEEYLNLLNFSLITDKSSLSNVYEEIGPYGSILALSPSSSTNLERLIMISDSESLIKFYKNLDSKLVYKKLGSRIVESIFKRLFECMYILQEEFEFKELVEFIEFKNSLKCKNATHVLRHVIMLLAAKKIEKFKVTKYKITTKENAEYAGKKLELYKTGFIEYFKELAGKGGTKELAGESRKKSVEGVARESKENGAEEIKSTNSGKKGGESRESGESNEDTLVTFCIFIQVMKSQSLIKYFYEIDFSMENLNKRQFIYDALIQNSNKSNLEALYEKIKDKISDSEFIEDNNYSMQSFIKRYKKPVKIFEKLEFHKYEKNSNIVLALLEALQENRSYREIKQLINEFYTIKNGVFSEFLLNKESGLNTKYIKAITNFMKMPKKYNFSVNDDFQKYFEPSWLSNKSGIELVIGYAAGNDGSVNKKEFFNRNIDKLWSSVKWKEGKEFIKQVTDYTDGHARKKAFEILSKFN